MPKLPEVKIKDFGSFAKVLIDGKNVSDKITAFTFHHQAGEIPKLNLEIVPDLLELEADECVVESRDAAGEEVTIRCKL